MPAPEAEPEQPYQGQGTEQEYLCWVPMVLHQGLHRGSDIGRSFRGGHRCSRKMTTMGVEISLIIQARSVYIFTKWGSISQPHLLTWKFQPKERLLPDRHWDRGCLIRTEETLILEVCLAGGGVGSVRPVIFLQIT